jgi:transposase
MPSGRHKEIPPDSLLQLRQRLDRLPRKSPERAKQIEAIASLYGISSTSVYRAMQRFLKPRSVHRADHGKPRILPKSELERYCEWIAALKLRTTNKNGRHLSTQRAIYLMEEYGIETPQGLVRAPKPGEIAPRTASRSLSGRTQQRLLAVRYVAVRSQVHRIADLGRPGQGSANTDAIQCGR